jgi:hypothetical protein
MVAPPADVLTAVNSLIASAVTPRTSLDLVRNWCMVAGQAGNNNKSHVFLDINLVPINKKKIPCGWGKK